MDRNPATFATSFRPQTHATPQISTQSEQSWHERPPYEATNTNIVITINDSNGSTGKGILIGMLSAFGSAGFVALLFLTLYFFRYTNRGRIILDRLGRPGEYDDEQAFIREEAEALETMDDSQRAEYLRAKGGYIYKSPAQEEYHVWRLTMPRMLCSLHHRQSPRNHAYGHFAVAVSRHTRKGGVGLGI